MWTPFVPAGDSRDRWNVSNVGPHSNSSIIRSSADKTQVNFFVFTVHLQLRNFSVFIDVERLEAGKFDNNLLQSIRQAKYFLLVLTPNALDRCQGDDERKDWVHREIVAALESNCKIIPILDNFQMPPPESLPEDMRAVCYFNGVRWVHDYQVTISSIWLDHGKVLLTPTSFMCVTQIIFRTRVSTNWTNLCAETRTARVTLHRRTTLEEGVCREI